MDNNHKLLNRTIDVSELLPQQPPFVMVDSLLSFDNDTTVCGYCVPEDGVFTHNGQENVMGMTLASAKVECEGETVATTEIKIALIETVVEE